MEDKEKKEKHHYYDPIGKIVVVDKEGARRLKKIANSPLPKYIAKIPAERIPRAQKNITYPY